MFKLQETERFIVFSEGLGSCVRVQKRVDASFVLLTGDDAQDMLDKLRDADGNTAVMEFWIGAWDHRFKRDPPPATFDNLLAPRRASSKRR